MTFNFLCVRVSVRVRKKAVEKRLSSGGSSLFFLAGFVGGRPLFFFERCVRVLPRDDDQTRR